jgi:hypothetical protein
MTKEQLKEKYYTIEEIYWMIVNMEWDIEKFKEFVFEVRELDKKSSMQGKKS